MIFDGARTEVAAFLHGHSGKYYVYVLCRPNGEPFYVGKGIGRRVFEHELEAGRHHPIGESNPFKCNVIRKIVREGETIRYRIDSIYHPDDQLRCLEREGALIRQHGRLHEGGCLTNLAGGVGAIAGPAPFSLARHAATLSGRPKNNPERSTLNLFIQGIGPVGSVPVKPIKQISRILPTTPHPSPRSPTARSAYALIASASASGLMLTANVEVPRVFVYDGVTGIIENGVARDILKADMAHLIPAADPKRERFALSAKHVASLIELVGSEALRLRGLI